MITKYVITKFVIYSRSHDHQVEAYLLDDLKTFEKQLNFNWDLIIFGRAYDLKMNRPLV